MNAFLNALISGSIRQRWLVLFLSIVVLVAAVVVVAGMPVDVFPELQAPSVTIMTEAPGYAAEEVELAVTFPIETAVNGLPGIRRVRSSSANGLSIVWAEFGFDTEIYRARQLVGERLDQAAESLPESVHSPEMAPISSVTGEIMLLALASPNGEVSPLELRRVAEFDLRTRLLAVPGVAQVTALGGELPEYQVLVRPEDLQRYGLTLDDIEKAAGSAHAPAGGGYLPNVDGRELPLRLNTRVEGIGDIAGTVVGEWRGAPLTLGKVATVQLGPAPKRGTGALRGKPAVILTIKKNPGINTLTLTDAIDVALDDFERSMNTGMVLERSVFRQADFIDVAIGNVRSAVIDGGIFVLIIVVLFLMNVRTTIITLAALPVSIGGALLVLHWFGATINVMTLGGLAVAIGSLVDDAIVDVENCFRRLRENNQLPVDQRKSIAFIVYISSVEIRRAILLATAVIVLVFVPLFFLSGIEGRFFRPLGVAYMAGLGVSLIVAMTLTPALCYILLGRAKIVEQPESAFVRFVKRRYDSGLTWCLKRPAIVLGGSALMAIGALLVGSTFGSSFLPEFNEGTITVFLNADPSTSLTESDRIARNIEKQLESVEGVAAATRRTGRAENDEHAEPVSASEIDIRVESGADMDAVREEIARRMGNVPGITTQLGGPISHRLSHILSGTPAAVAIKVYGGDLPTLRTIARETEAALKPLAGVRDLVANREVLSAVLPVEFDREALAQYGLTPHDVAHQVETAFLGRTVGTVNAGTSQLNIVMRLVPEARTHPDDVGEFLLKSPSGGHVRLRKVAKTYEAETSGLITRENVKRKAVISCNVAVGHNLGDLVAQIRERVTPIVAKYPGTFVEYGGQFEAQEEASRRIGWASVGVLAVIIVMLYASFGSWRPVALVLFNLPLALVGGVAALFIADSPNLFSNLAGLVGIGHYTAPVLSIASLVGFIGLAGMAIRNGLLLISHYYHLVEAEGVSANDAVVRAAQERLVPILMTALSSALALVPLVWSRGEVGSELQYPLAVVMVGGLVSSTFLNLAVIPIGLKLFGGGARPVTVRAEE